MPLASDSWYATIGGTPAVVTTLTALAIAIAVTRYYWIKGKDITALGWTPLGISRIVTRPVASVSKGLQLTWNGRSLDTPYTVRVRICNVGTTAIARDRGDREVYSESLSVGFKKSVCYEAIITRTSSDVIMTDDTGSVVNLPVAILDNPPERNFTIRMPALNRSRWIELEMIADGEVEYPRVNCVLASESFTIMPIAGRQRQRIRSSMRGLIGLGIFIATAGFGLLGWQSFTNLEGPSIWPVILIIIGTIVALITATVYGWSWLADRSQWTAMKRLVPSAFERSGSETDPLR